MGPVTFAEAYYGPTYHIKDISMQFIGQFLKYLVRKDEENDRVGPYQSFSFSILIAVVSCIRRTSGYW